MIINSDSASLEGTCPKRGISRQYLWLAVQAVLLLAGCNQSQGIAAGNELVIYSPAPPTILLHDQNIAFGSQLAKCGIANRVESIALPESINNLASMPAVNRARHLPIVTTIDFLPAVKGSGPDWHRYERVNQDLKFVMSLYDVAFGVLVFDDAIESRLELEGVRIGVPPRPSAVRLYTEALLRDGWGIFDSVELVDIVPPELPGAISEGLIDATTWSLLVETPDGFKPLLPALFELPQAHYIGVDMATAERINAANDFQIGIVAVSGTGIPRPTPDAPTIQLLSFAQGLAAWDQTPDHIVSAILHCSDPGRVATRDWPGLTDQHLHSAAIGYKSGSARFPTEPLQKAVRR